MSKNKDADSNSFLKTSNKATTQQRKHSYLPPDTHAKIPCKQNNTASHPLHSSLQVTPSTSASPKRPPNTHPINLLFPTPKCTSASPPSPPSSKPPTSAPPSTHPAPGATKIPSPSSPHPFLFPSPLPHPPLTVTHESAGRLYPHRLSAVSEVAGRDHRFGNLRRGIQGRGRGGRKEACASILLLRRWRW